MNYLVLIGHVDVLRVLFGEVVVPEGVIAELQDDRAPDAVRQWVAIHPEWLKVRSAPASNSVGRLGLGEEQAIRLAADLGADLLLVDDSDARQSAEAAGLRCVGTIGVLQRAAGRGLLDLRTALELLKHTSFRISDHILQEVLSSPPTPNLPSD